MFQNPAPDVAFITSGIAREEGGAVHHDSDITGIPILIHMRQHMLQEQHLSVTDAWQSRFEPPATGCGRLLLNGGTIGFPLIPVGRIGKLVVEPTAGEGVAG